MSVHTEYSDQQLLQQLAGNDHAAFDALYERHWFAMYQTAYYLLKDADASKDIVQDVLLWVWQNRATLTVNNLSAYLKAAVRFKVANHIRSGKIRDSFFDECVRAASGDFTLVSEQETAEVKELQQIIHETIAQLPEKCREIYQLSRECGLSNRDIAERLGLSVKTVEAQVTIALRRLRTRVGYRLICLLIFYGVHS